VRAQLEAEELEERLAAVDDDAAPDAPGALPEDGPAAASDDDDRPPAR
jgi:hypothetical protein